MASKTPVTTVHPSHTQSQKASTEPHKKYKKKNSNKKKNGMENEWSMTAVFILSLWNPCKERLILPFKRVSHFFLPRHIYLLSGILLKIPRCRLPPKARWCIFLLFAPSPLLSYLGKSILRSMSSCVCSL